MEKRLESRDILNIEALSKFRTTTPSHAVPLVREALP
jgi:hypothetical protein